MQDSESNYRSFSEALSKAAKTAYLILMDKERLENSNLKMDHNKFCMSGPNEWAKIPSQLCEKLISIHGNQLVAVVPSKFDQV